ncbi:MAG TPA: hypothetical protein VG317_09790 [Pseudonocardiaceae bacterium]|nr:hypothetical protein [Pseudonocardiaceae bacterium]
MSIKGPVRLAAVMCGPLLIGAFAATNAAATPATTSTPSSLAAAVAPLAASPVHQSLFGLCNPLFTPQPTDSFPGTVVKADNFESGLSGYTLNTAGTGSVAISSSQAHTGSCSVHIHATTDSTSLANMSVNLPSGNEVYTDGWFNITAAGVAGNDVPYFRFFAGSTRVMDVYRYNDNGQLWLRVLSPDGTFAYTRLTLTAIPLNAWHHVQTHVIANGSSSTVEVWFDGTQLLSTNQVNTSATSLSSVMLGSEHLKQMEDNYVDDLIVKAH